MSKETLKIGVDLGTEKDEQCAVINLHYNGIDHIIYETHDKELVGVLNRIMCHLEAIDNANPSEALIAVDKILGYFGGDDVQIETMTLVKSNVLKIKQALLKAQEPKQYLKWEDLKFDRKEAEYIKVSLNGTKYCLVLTWGYCEPKLVKVKPINLYEGKETDGQTIFLLDGNYINDKQFFNDLHLERVEE